MDHREKSGDLRGRFALAALGVFVLTVVGALILVGADRWDEAREFLGLVLPVQIALVGAAARYYFGNRKSD